ncbi:NAD(P)/FAD-dependent oxidoreductase [Aurantibacter aestuarii]|uniref:Pyridine nucleotide-disulfide oxidoreductase n=1 Tax=Aurantibacter aestuarii TaxID=1266046 RepID=A0A2T1NDE9_9FLAO|nr:NAD(P)/FAD-dependent oxidoreductase [Aurantibacter aestuarii]PSG90459.1 pyridine nucleotide-disulfide oxidoreductase [Aurantibacter aestuarii]
MKDNPSVDILIIGAGPAGCVAAMYLKQKGYNVLVVEKNEFPRFAIGESLLPRCMEHFTEVGLFDAINQAGFEKKYGARFIRGNDVCEFDFSDKFTEGWDWTWQVPRAEFDKVLTDTLEKHGVKVLFNTEVLDVDIQPNGSSTSRVKHIKNASEKTILAKFIIDCSGYGRLLANQMTLNKASDVQVNASVFTHVKDVNRPKGKEGTLITFDVLDLNTWLWVIPFSNGNTSLGVVSNEETIKKTKGDAFTKLNYFLNKSEHYKQRFKDCEPIINTYDMCAFSKSATKLYGTGFALTGNSAEFLDPVFSSGVTFATESALKAAQLTALQLKGDLVNWETDYELYIKSGVNVFKSYVKEWYTGNLQTLFFNADDNLENKRQICSVLAGYVWDIANPFVKHHDRILPNLAYLTKMKKNS